MTFLNLKWLCCDKTKLLYKHVIKYKIKYVGRSQGSHLEAKQEAYVKNGRTKVEAALFHDDGELSDLAWFAHEDIFKTEK